MEDIFDTITCIYLGLSFGLPGLWWLYCNKKERDARKAFIAQPKMNAPERKPRYW